MRLTSALCPDTLRNPGVHVTVVRAPARWSRRKGLPEHPRGSLPVSGDRASGGEEGSPVRRGDKPPAEIALRDKVNQQNCRVQRPLPWDERLTSLRPRGATYRCRMVVLHSPPRRGSHLILPTFCPHSVPTSPYFTSLWSQSRPGAKANSGLYRPLATSQ